MTLQDAESTHEFVGRHLIINYLGCDSAALADSPGILKAMEEAVRASGASLLKTVHQDFLPSGFTALLLLSESHASIHTYPESSACFVDLFTCGRACVAERFHDVLHEYLRPTGFCRRVVIRHEAIEDDSFYSREEKPCTI